MQGKGKGREEKGKGREKEEGKEGVYLKNFPGAQPC
jgi:hypothetical protein